MIKMLLFVLISASLMSGCMSYSFKEADLISKGMTPTMVLAVSRDQPTVDVPFIVKGHETSDYRVIVYRLALASNTSDFYIIFENDKVIYWGHPYEFKRHPDQTLNDIGKAAYEAVQVSKKK